MSDFRQGDNVVLKSGGFSLNRSRMIKIALGVYDILEITIGARSPTPSS
jgi:hypothetical protein